MLVASKRAGCDVWQLECQASSVTASVLTNWQPSTWHTLTVFVAIDQSHRQLCSAEIQPMHQQDAATALPYCGLVLHTHRLLHYAPDALICRI